MFGHIHVGRSMLQSACIFVESYGLPQVPVLETVLGQTEETLNEMTKAGIGASAFAQLTDLVPLCKGKKGSLPL